jgi:hypothetical protein
LPLKPVFAPFWQQMLHFLDNVSAENRTVQVGEIIAPRKALLETALRSGKTGIDLNQAVVVLDPARRRLPMSPGVDSLFAERIGLYEVRTANLSATVAANPVPRESDLAHGNAEEMAAGWAPLDPRSMQAASDDERLSPEDQDRRQRFWRYLMLAALIFFLSEALLANQFVLKPD